MTNSPHDRLADLEAERTHAAWGVCRSKAPAEQPTIPEPTIFPDR